MYMHTETSLCAIRRCSSWKYLSTRQCQRFQHLLNFEWRSKCSHATLSLSCSKPWYSKSPECVQINTVFVWVGLKLNTDYYLHQGGMHGKFISYHLFTLLLAKLNFFFKLKVRSISYYKSMKVSFDLSKTCVC